MAIVVRCECGRQLQAKDEFAGRRTKCPDCGRELTIPGPGDAPAPADVPYAFDDADLVAPAPRRAPASGYDPDFEGHRHDKGRVTTSGMAITSLVLGIMTFVPCLGILTFLPAIILGILALNSIGKSQGRVSGKGLAIGGISTGGVGGLFVVIGTLIALLLPAVQAAREAARRAECSNHLKQVGLAMHNYHASHNRFPGRAIVDKDGKPLLSWRVAILPYIEQEALYSKFHLDEPWDSPHNMSLVAEMPAAYACPSDPTQTKLTGMTGYRGFTGPGTMFEDDKGVGMASIIDGTSQTLLVVESPEHVTWTQPEELAYDPNSPTLPPVGSRHPGGFNALFADGSTRFIRSSINPVTLRALITRNGNEVPSGSEY